MNQRAALRIRVLLFAALREALGRASLDLAVPRGATVRDALQLLRERHPELAGRTFATARNKTYALESALLEDDDELALIPPVSGG